MCVHWSQDLHFEMAASVVNDALAKAARRAQRLAELDMAHTTIEKLLNFPHPPQTLPWGDAMSTSYFLEKPLNAQNMSECCCHARMNGFFI